MAKKDDELELDVAEDEKKKGGGMMKIVMFVVIGLVLVGGAVGTTLFLVGGNKADTEAVADASDSDAKPAKGEKKKKKKQAGAKPVFFEMTPPFVVNLNDTESNVRYLQVSVSLMTYSPEDMNQVKEYLPLIKNRLILLLGEQKFNALRTKQGKEALQAAALKTVREGLEEMTGDPLVEGLFITSIVGQ